VDIYNWNNKNMKIVTFAITERPSQGVDQARAQPSQGRQPTPTLKSNIYILKHNPTQR